MRVETFFTKNIEFVNQKFPVMPDLIRHSKVGRYPEQDEYLSVHMLSFDHALNMIYKGDMDEAI